MNQALPVQSLASQPEEDIWIPSVCRVCSNCCGIQVHRKNGVVVKIDGLPGSPHNDGCICAKGQAAIMGIYDPARPKRPLIRMNPEKGIGVVTGLPLEFAFGNNWAPFAAKTEVPKISVEALRRRMERGEPIVVIDARKEPNDEEGAIPGAIRIPPDAIADQIREIPPNREVIVYCS